MAQGDDQNFRWIIAAIVVVVIAVVTAITVHEYSEARFCAEKATTAAEYRECRLPTRTSTINEVK